MARLQLQRLKKRSLFVLALPFSVLPSGHAWAEQCNGGATVTGTLAISTNCAGGSVRPLNLDTGADVTVNSGVTVYNDAGSGRNGDGISVLSSATASSLVNNGTIATGQQIGVIVNGTLTSLLNAGRISSNVRRGLVLNGSSAVLGTVTNTGSIVGPFAGISNLTGGVLQTFNNLQGAGNANGPVTYSGVVPTNYNIIINSPATYGKFTKSSTETVSGSMIFGIYGTSTVAIGSYTGVLNGFTVSNLTGLTSGTYGGLNWALNLASGSNNVWNLVFSAASTSMALGTSYALTDLGVSVNRVFDGGTLALRSGDNSSGAFTLNAAGGRISAAAGGSAQLSGVLSGVGGLTVDGAGLVALTGSNSYSGGTTVNSGTLSVGGDSALGSGAVFVASGATMMGSGRIMGPVTVAGTLKPGNSPGYLAVNSTLTMNSGSTYQQDIAGTVQSSAASPAGAAGYYSFVNITGGQFVIQANANLTPRLSNLFTAGEAGFGSTTYTPVLGDRFRIVTADGGITGRFSTLTQPAELSAGTQFVQFYNLGGNKSLDLAVIPTSYTTALAAHSANTRSAASVLDGLARANQSGTATVAQDLLLFSAAGRNAATLPAFTRTLAGEVYGATLAVAPQAGLRMQQAVLSHLDETGPVVALSIAHAGRGSLLSSADHRPVPGLQLPAPVSNPSSVPSAAWGEIAYQRGHRSGDQNASGSTHDLYQVVVGGDFYARDDVKAGSGLTLSNTDVSASQGQGELRQGAAFVYARVPAARWVLDALASWGMQSTRHRRSDVTGLTAGLDGQANGRDALLSAGLSRPTDWHGMVVSPYARLTWQQQHRSSVNEGDSAAALNVDSFEAQGLRGVLGLTLGSGSSQALQDNQTCRFNLGLGADSRSLLNPELSATLAGMPIIIRAPQSGSGFIQLGFYGTRRLSGQAFGYLGVSTEARRGSMLGSAQAGVRVAF